jgi:nitrogen regulatory protein PII
MRYDWQILTMVDHGLGERLAAHTRAKGARGGTILVGRGEIPSRVLRALALADVERDVLVTLVTDDQIDAILDAIARAPCIKRGTKGISIATRIGGNAMNGDAGHELITIIVNRGYADDVMNAARKAGAKGGTILNARGTGKPDDAKFFGITVVPEKEELLIVVDRERAKAVQDAISSLPCHTTPGIGVMYTAPVERFVQLGKQA